MRGQTSVRAFNPRRRRCEDLRGSAGLIVMELGGLTVQQITSPIPNGGKAAAVRSAMYALCSELVGSPFDMPEGTSLAATAGELVELEALLPYDVDLRRLGLAALDQQLNDVARCRRQYGGLFEVGDRGPPVPIRESLAVERDPGVKERLIRFFDFFGYRVDAQQAWASDHIAVELEFMHWLCFHEAGANNAEQQSSYQHAQRDFLAGHILNWLPELAGRVARSAPAGPYSQIFASVQALAAADLAYRSANLTHDSEGGPP